MLDIILFTHDDLDGAGCSVIFKLAHSHLESEKFKIIHCSNNNINKKVELILESGMLSVETIICFGDICPSADILRKLAGKFSNIQIWDHHKTNLYAVDIIPDAIIIPEDSSGRLESGTSLMFQYFNRLCRFPIPYDEFFGVKLQELNINLLLKFVENIRSYDTYEWKNTNNYHAKELQTLFYLLGMDRFVKKYVEKIKDPNIEPNLISWNDLIFVKAKIEQEQEAIDAISINDVNLTTIKGLRAAVRFSNGGMNIGELAYQFLKKYPDIDIFVGINIAGNNYNIRTIREDLDTGYLIAQPAGGGGHPKASGCPIPLATKDEILKLFLHHLDHETFEGDFR